MGTELVLLDIFRDTHTDMEQSKLELGSIVDYSIVHVLFERNNQ
jgi:uncharacterized membrane protein (DUF373 family)